MKKKWIIIRIETKVREFYSKIFLAYHLAEAGYGVIIKNELGGELNRYPKGIYLINSMYKNTRAILRDITDKGNIVYMLDEEGLVMLNKDRYLDRIDDGSFPFVSKFMCYGYEQYKILSDAYPENEDKLLITGNPRINLLNEGFRNIENYNVNLRNQYGDYILIVSNFSLVNMFGAQKSKEARYERAFKQLKEMKLNKTANEFKEQFDYSNELFEYFLKMVRDIALQFPDLSIIVRPHPSESPDIWKEIDQEYNNVRVIYDGPLSAWIKESKLIIQNSCTSAIESLFLDKSCISYRPIRHDKFDQPLPNKVSINVETVNEIFQIIDRISKEEGNIFQDEYKVFKNHISKHIANSERDDSVKKILSAIQSENIIEENYSKSKYKVMKYTPTIILKRFIKKNIILGAFLVYSIMKFLNLKKNRLYNFLDRKITLYRISKKYENNKSGTILKTEIEEILQGLNDVYLKNNCFNVDRLDNNVFMINKKNKS